MERIKETIEQLINDYNNVIYDLGILIGYTKKDWDNELIKKDHYDKARVNDLYQVEMQILENITKAVNSKYEYEERNPNLLDKLEAYYNYASLKEREAAKKIIEKAEKNFEETKEDKEENE